MPRLYQIYVSHLLNETWSEWFDGLTIIPREDGTTLLSGILDDPAVLHTVLNKIRNLNLNLVSVSYTKVAENTDEIQ